MRDPAVSTTDQHGPTSFFHVSHDAVPVALAELHRSLEPGATVSCWFMPGPDDHVDDSGTLRGRAVWRWSDQHLVDVFVGAGFEDVRLSGEGTRIVDAVRARTLPDSVSRGMRLLVCGLNPSLRAADAGTAFITPGNRFWPAALAAGLASVDRDPWHALEHHGMGMTDLAKRATRRADELAPGEYREGLGRVDRLCARFRPDAVCMVGLTGWRTAVDRKAVAGWQDTHLGGRPVYVMPSTSGLNAHSRPAELVEHLRTALGGS
jgi:TDG/mug DNA glycosylase family protein